MFKQMNNLYKGYSSRYSGSFPLGNNFRYPKPCMEASVNLTNGMVYYRG